MCLMCNNSGWIVAFNRKTGATHSFQSGCGIAENRGLSKSIPVWTQDKFKNYSLEPLPRDSLPHPTPPEKIEPQPIKKDPSILKVDPHHYDIPFED